MTLSLPPNSIPPGTAAVAQHLAELTAECEAAESTEDKAQLYLQLGEQLISAGDYRQAATALLAAVNANAGFAEPLEKLLFVIEKRGSTKNLSRALERKLRIVRTPAHAADVRLKQACILLTTPGGDAEAMRLVEEAVALQPDRADCWALLQFLAGRVGDDDAKLRALTQLARLGSAPERRAWALLDAASVKLQLADLESAEVDLDEVARSDGDGALLQALRLAAFQRLEQLGRSEGRTDLIARSLEREAALLMQPLPETRALLERINGAEVSDATLADTLIRGAYSHLGQRNVATAKQLLDRAREQWGSLPLIELAAARAALATSDSKTLASIAAHSEEAGGSSHYLSALRTLAGWACLTEHLPSEAAAQFEKALRHREDNHTARAAALNLQSTEDPSLYAKSLEDLAGTATERAARQRLFLQATAVWALRCSNAEQAMGALRQAMEAGLDAELAHAIGRFIASACGSATLGRELIDAQASRPNATTSTLIEALIAALGRDGEGSARAHALAKKLEQRPESAWLGSAVRAYVLALSKDTPDDPQSLLDLAQTVDREEVASLLRCCAALRWNQRGELGQALTTLVKHEPQADLFQSVLLATFAQREGNLLLAARTLAAEAERAANRELGFALSVTAGLLFWRGGERTQAVALLEAAEVLDADGIGDLLDWARRAENPNAAPARRQALVSQAARTPDSARIALERFGLELAAEGGDAAAAMALDGISTDSKTNLGVAVELARALWPGTGEDAHEDGLEYIASLSPAARGAAAAARYYDALGADRQADALKAVRAWFDTDPGCAAAAEWLGRSRALSHTDAEVEALLALANRLGGRAGTELASLAASVAGLTDQGRAPWVTGVASAAALSNLEHSRPGDAPARRAAAMNTALGHGALGNGSSVGSGLVIVGLNQLVAEAWEDASNTFRRATEQEPGNLAAWEGLRDASQRTGQVETCLDATVQLAGLCRVPSTAARFYEEAARLCFDELNRPVEGRKHLQRAVEKDIRRVSAFEALFRLERAEGNHEELLKLIALRLDISEEPNEIVKLYWERARALRQQDDLVGALEALDNVRLIEADHPASLALTGEIFITQGRFEAAAAALRELALTTAAPKKQRLVSGITAADLFEKKLEQPERALELLETLRQSGLGALALKERIARTAVKTADWQRALDALADLMAEREDVDGRVEAARLAVAIHRDELGTPGAARAAVDCLLAEVPSDAETLELILSGCFDEVVSRAWLRAAHEALLAEVQEDPLDPEPLLWLARIAGHTNDTGLRQVALGCLAALGQTDAELQRELEQLNKSSAFSPRALIGQQMLVALDPEQGHGQFTPMMRALAPYLVEALGPTLESLGVNRGDRVKASAGSSVRSDIAAWAGALGIDKFELYVGGKDDRGIFAVATETPNVVVGARVDGPLPQVDLAVLASELWALRQGLTVFTRYTGSEAAAVVEAALRLGEQPDPKVTHPLLSQFERELDRVASRRLKKTLRELAPSIRQHYQDIPAWIQQSQFGRDRLAAAVVGDISYVLCPVTRDRGGQAAAQLSQDEQERTAQLIRFVVTPQFAELRKQLGVGPR